MSIELTPEQISVQITERLNALPEQRVEIVSDLRWAFREAAAVRASFDPSTLRPALWFEPSDVGEGAAFTELFDDSFVPYGRRQGKPEWVLKADVRQQTLPRLATKEAIARALDANATAPASVLDRMLAAYLRGDAPAVEKQSLDELNATTQVVEWLGSFGKDLPNSDRLKNRIEIQRLFGPFELLTKRFAGREADLEKLRKFVGVMPADSVAESLFRGLRLLLNIVEKPPAVVWGPGGAGKSTLIFEFIQQHVQARQDTKFPFVYLDFNNPNLRMENAQSLLSEAARQLRIQYPASGLVFDPDAGRELRSLQGHSGAVAGVAMSADGRRAVSASADKTLKVWDLESGRELRSLQGYDSVVAMSADGRRAVSAKDKTIKVWDLESGRELRSLEGHSGPVVGVAVSADGRRAVSASLDKTLKVWDLESNRELRSLQVQSDFVFDVAVSADGRRAASASFDLKVWDLESGREFRSLEGHSGPVFGVAVSADGRRAVSASSDKTLKVWDLESGRELRSLNGHTAWVTDVAVSADWRRAISASVDQTLKVWDLETGRELYSLQGHTGAVLGVAISADGRRAVSASRDGTLKVWDLTDRTRKTLIEIFAKSLKETLQKELGPPSGSASDLQLPLLMVFDTFEEVQYAGKTPEIELSHFFLDLRKNYRNVRAVVSGRAYPAELKSTLDAAPIDIEIKDFDEDSANAYLKNLGVDQADFRKRLIAQVGGNPLSLKLAAEVFLREGGDEKGIRNLKTTNWLILGVSEAKVQGQLYERILGHLHGDPDLKALAHPGLVLRRITPDIIRNVLQKPCKISVPTAQRAQELFDALKREVSLVEVAEDGSAHHRADVRKMMLGDLKRDKHPEVAEIEEAAVAYYSNQTGFVARAEEIYHRLRRCEDEKVIDDRWLRGVEPYLRGALVDSGGATVEELGAKQRLYLSAKLGVPVADKLRADADLESWERYVVAQARTRLRSGYFEEALKLLRERKERSAGSPLHLVEAKALFGLVRYSEAEEILRKAFDSEAMAGDVSGQLQCALLGAMLSARLGRPADARGYLETAEALAAKAEDRVRMVQILLYQLVLNQGVEPSVLAGLQQRLPSAMGKLTVGESIRNRSLIRSTMASSPTSRELLENGLLSDMPAAGETSAGAEKFETYLTQATLRGLADATAALGLTSPATRRNLFEGIDPSLLASLPILGDASQQAQSDLNQLNTLQRLPDGSIPMLIWLQNAVAFSPAAAQSEIFKTALDQMRAATGQYDLR